MRENFGRDTLDREVDEGAQNVDGADIEKENHQVSNLQEIFASGIVLYTYKQKQLCFEIEFLENFCEALGLNLTTKIIPSGNLINMTLPCIRVNDSIVEKFDIIPLLFSAYLSVKKISDLSTKAYLEYLLQLAHKLGQALTYEMWFNQEQQYAFRNKLFSLLSPLQTLQNVFHYKLEKDYMPFSSQAEMMEKTKPVIEELDKLVQNIKYFKIHQKTVGFGDILLFSVLHTIYFNVPSSSIVKQLDANTHIASFYGSFLNLKENFPLEKLIKPEIKCDVVNEKRERAQIAEMTNNRKIISACVASAFWLIYFIGVKNK